MKRTPLKRMSEKRRVEYQERAAAMRVVRARSGGRCEAAALIARVDPVAASKCLGYATDGHEKLKRSRGGSISDPANIAHVCRACHEWTEAEPARATEVGLLVSGMGR